ncbi:MAG: hypothetical protein MI924_25370 [Chloroflexales bacterium]|nr:hypothetical protein [Chloroflexales bacterium]
MTIAISLKVNDGVVLAADSASTLVAETAPNVFSVVHIYHYANKIFNLRKGFPIGVITWGAGNIGAASISTLVKDLRRRLSGGAEEWRLSDRYTVKEAAEKFREFMFEETYLPVFKDAEKKPDIGFILAGYSAAEGMAEEYQIDIIGGDCPEPRLLRPKEQSGLTWSGEPEAITRLVMGFGVNLPHVLQQNLGVPAAQVDVAVDVIRQALTIPLVVDAMPIQDAIDLAEFLVDTTIKFSRFTPGPATVGGPIEIAAISKHEGFKWVRRKHYYHRDMNGEEHEDGAIIKHHG